MTALINSLGNKQWIEKNIGKAHKVFPEKWTHSNDVNFVSIGYQLKMLGIDYRRDELAKVFEFLARTGVIEHKRITAQTAYMRRSPTFKVKQ